MAQILKSRWARVAFLAVLLATIYAVAGFVVAPKLVRSAILEDVPKTLPRVRARVGEIRINPFLLHIEVRDLALSDEAGAKLAGFERLYVEFEFASLWRRAYSFGTIEIDAPMIDARVAKNGTLNLEALRPAPAQRVSTKAEEGTLPPIRVDYLKVARGSASYTDSSRPTEFTARLEPVEFELKDFTTAAQGGLFSFSGITQRGETLEWHGHLSVQPIESDGELRIAGLRAHTLWEYLADRVAFVVGSGRIDAQASYRFALREAAELEVKVPRVSVADLTLRPKGADADWITVPSLTIDGVSVELAPRHAAIESLSITGLKVSAWREADGGINLLELAAPPSASTAPTPTPAAASAAAAPGAPAAPWRFELARLQIKDASLSAEDRTTRPAAKLLLAPLSAQVTGVSLDLKRPVHVALDTRINQQGALTVSGEITPQPAAAALSLKLDALDLTAAQPYIAAHSGMILRGGVLAVDGRLDYAGAGRRPAFKFAGNVHVNGLHTLDAVRQDDFVNWDRLDILGLAYQQSPDRLDIASIRAFKPYARVTIEADKSLNVARVLTAPGAAPGAPGAATGAAKGAAAAAAGGAVSVAQAGPAAGRERAPAAASGMAQSIKKIEFTDGTTNFTDLSIDPNFSAGIQNLQGSVTGLSSDPASRAKIDLKGQVDAYSPVSIAGEANVLSAATYADLAMSFRNIELTIFNPYSGKFAGYNISKGKLTTELHYKVDHRRLDAQHHIVIDQLEFGDKTASKDAVSLPVKLGVALLKDRNGVIDLDLPVGGSLDDPKFKLGPVIWKVIVNILEKAVTAPFALLGRLFGGGPDLEYVEFQPGNPDPDPAGLEKMKAVGKALAERPQLKIDLPIGVVPPLDGPALSAAMLDAELAALQAQARGANSKAGGAAPAVSWKQLDPERQLDLLMRLYTQKIGHPPEYPASVTAIAQKPDAVAAKIGFLRTELAARESVSDAQLRALGEQRAQGLQQALLKDSQIDPARVFLVANDKASAKDGVVRLQLSLK